MLLLYSLTLYIWLSESGQTSFCSVLSQLTEYDYVWSDIYGLATEEKLVNMIHCQQIQGYLLSTEMVQNQNSENFVN